MVNPTRIFDRRRWQRLLVLAGFLALIAAAGFVAPESRSWPDTCSGRPCIQVGTFNLYFKSPDQFGVLKEELEARGYELFGAGGTKAQNVLIAYDTDEVERKGRRTLLVPTSFDFGDGCTSSNLRLPLAVDLQAGALRFWVVGVHLKSQIGEECADRVRQRQANDLRKAIRKQLGAKKGHVFIAGDFNALASDDSLKPLKTKGKFTPLTRRANRAPGSGSVSFLKDPFRSLIDHVMYRKRDSKKAWVKKSTLVFDPDSAGDEFSDFINRYSDHAPVYTSFYTDRE